MSALNRIAYFQNRRDERPNQELAAELAKRRDRSGIREIAENLWNQNRDVQSDCLKVLYEIGYIDPELIADYVTDFLKLLAHKNNRLVWGSMIALSTIAHLKADELFGHVAEIEGVLETGSVITRDNGVKVLAAVAAQQPRYRREIFPYLLKHLETCRPKDVPQHAEQIVGAVNADNRSAFLKVLNKRMVDLSGSQTARIKKVIKDAERRAAESP
jgi:hypothetical protein